MPQQINLCSPTQRIRQQIFSARTMLRSLAVFWVLGGVLCAVMVWNLQRSTAEFTRLVQSQTQEIEKLKAATDAEAINIAGTLKDVPTVVAAFQAFIAEVTSKSTWSDVLAAQSKLITDYDTLGASAKTAVAKLEADV